jgi:superfamily II DNA or RNA helicase
MRQQMNDYKRRRLKEVPPAEAAPRAVLGAGCRVPVSSLPDGALRAAQHALTFFPASAFDRNPGAGAPPPPVQSYRVEDDGTLVVPRCYGARVFSADPSGLADGDPAPGLAFIGKLRGRQVEAAEASLASLRALPHAAMLVLPCGFGKTVVGLSIAASLGRKTLVVVHKEFLLEQWRERIAAFLPSAKVGTLQGPKCEVEGRDVVVAMIQSLVTRDYGSDSLESFGTVLLDEAHHLAARLFSEVFFRVRAKHVLGLTATPKRKDACTALLHEHMGAFAFREDPDPGAALVVRVTYPSPWQSRRDEELAPAEAQRLKTKMTRDLVRNRLLVSWCLKAAAAGRRTLLLSDRVQHLHDLREAYEARRPADDSSPNQRLPSAVYVGGLKRADREAASEATTIFGTFSLAQEGLDIPALDTLVLATPASDVTQALGRILRACEGKMRPVVVDVLDDPCKNFRRLNDVRATVYRKRAFEVRDVASDDHSALG